MAWKNKEKQSAYWQRVKEKYNSSFREKYATDNDFKKQVLARARKWRENNPEKAKEMLRRQSAKRLRLRFDILRRDNFTCQYCGRKAPDVVLHIDHVLAKANGGINNVNNYITACSDCNIGKSDVLLA